MGRIEIFCAMAQLNIRHFACNYLERPHSPTTLKSYPLLDKLPLFAPL